MIEFRERRNWGRAAQLVCPDCGSTVFGKATPGKWCRRCQRIEERRQEKVARLKTDDLAADQIERILTGLDARRRRLRSVGLTMATDGRKQQ